MDVHLVMIKSVNEAAIAASCTESCERKKRSIRTVVPYKGVLARKSKLIFVFLTSNIENKVFEMMDHERP